MKPIITSTTLSCLVPPSTHILSLSSAEAPRPDSPSHPSRVFQPTASLVSVTATQPMTTVPVGLLGILTSVLTVLAPTFLSHVSSSFICSSSAMHLFSAPVISLPQLSSPTATPSFLQPPMAPEPAVSSTRLASPSLLSCASV